jgi:hypothetical protein
MKLFERKREEVEGDEDYTMTASLLSPFTIYCQNDQIKENDVAHMGTLQRHTKLQSKNLKRTDHLAGLDEHERIIFTFILNRIWVYGPNLTGSDWNSTAGLKAQTASVV